MSSFQHGGNIHKILRENSVTEDEILDFSANINPLGPPEWLRSTISKNVESLVHYPDPDNNLFIKAVANFTKKVENQIVASNGSTELLYTFLRVVSYDRVLIPVPSYVDYERAAKLACSEVVLIETNEENSFCPDLFRLENEICDNDLIILATPNNPTGTCVDKDELISLISRKKNAIFLMDEAFSDFIENYKCLGGLFDNVCSINSMTKFYGIPGLRLGYGVFPQTIAEKIRHHLPPWSVNTFSQIVGPKCLQDTQYQNNSRKVCLELRQSLVKSLHQIPGLHLFNSEANYIFAKIGSGKSVKDLTHFCLKNGIMIRDCTNYNGLQDDKFFRIAVRTSKENNKLIGVFKEYFKVTTTRRTSKKKSSSIMFQGTCSDSGKSIITAALCRILLQDGLRVAPFKSQNMSLNSFVTLQGDEMGRAQVVQAQASGLDPDYRMNPVLLKPNSDTGSQVVVCGKPVGNMSVTKYNTYKPEIWPKVCDSYKSLAAEHDVIVLEGAGSPGEVNLKADDIVNMKMAQFAKAPVIVIGDIDRGGVYASFAGIMEVLSEWERSLIQGFLVNKFRGQSSLLDSAHLFIKEHTGREVIGVIPFIPNLGVPEEDSVSFKKGLFNKNSDIDGIDIAVISLPHISNFTDVEPFLEEPDVSLRIIERREDIKDPDVLILPGSKNVITDIRYLKENGFNDEINRCVERGTEIIGICGGYQILGQRIKDPYCIESTGEDSIGLGYLEMDTIIEKQKCLTRQKGTHIQSGKPVYGYEIHHGISTTSQDCVLSFDNGSACGLSCRNGQIWGSYLHGIFDSDEFRRWFIDRVRVSKNLDPIGEVVFSYDLEKAFDSLADCVRKNIDMDYIYKLLNL